MSKEQEKISQSLFGDDVRHSVDTVKERWAREKARRRRFTLKVILPCAIAAIAIWAVTFKALNIFPFYVDPRIKNYQKRMEKMAKEPPKPVENKTLMELGNKDGAKMRLLIIVPDDSKLPESWEKILYEFTDTKPSEIFVEVYENSKTDNPLKKILLDPSYVAFSINGDSSFNVRYPDGKNRALEGMFLQGSEFPELELSLLLNQYYRKSYGVDKDAVNVEKMFAERTKKVEEHRRSQPPTVISTNDKGNDDVIQDERSIVLPDLQLDTDK